MAKFNVVIVLSKKVKYYPCPIPTRKDDLPIIAGFLARLGLNLSYISNRKGNGCNFRMYLTILTGGNLRMANLCFVGVSSEEKSGEDLLTYPVQNFAICLN